MMYLSRVGILYLTNPIKSNLVVFEHLQFLKYWAVAPWFYFRVTPQAKGCPPSGYGGKPPDDGEVYDFNGEK